MLYIYIFFLFFPRALCIILGGPVPIGLDNRDATVLRFPKIINSFQHQLQLGVRSNT